MNAASLRRQLAEFLGDERFRKFVAELRHAGRLRYWQEQAWAGFAAAHPDYERVSAENLRIALRVCELHGAELQPDEVLVVEGNIDYTERYLRARRAEFPNAAVGPFYTEGAPSPGPTIDVWFCQECRRTEARWTVARNRQGTPTDLDLTRRTTLDEYGVMWGYNSLTERARERWLALRAVVEAVLSDGGDLWEWETVGFREFAGVCGLAVVRDGTVIKSWQLAKS